MVVSRIKQQNHDVHALYLLARTPSVTLTLPYVSVVWSFHESSYSCFLYSLNLQLGMLSSCLLCFVWIPEINNFPIQSTSFAQWRPYIMEKVERWIHLMKVGWTVCQVTKHSHATPLAYQSIRSINFQIFPHKNMSWRLSWIYLYRHVCRHGLYSTPPMFWAKLQITCTLQCVTLSTVFYTLQFTYKKRSLYCMKLLDKRGYMIYTRLYIFQAFLVRKIFCICVSS